jgi:hypothetical protein
MASLLEKFDLAFPNTKGAWENWRPTRKRLKETGMEIAFLGAMKVLRLFIGFLLVFDVSKGLNAIELNADDIVDSRLRMTCSEALKVIREGTNTLKAFHAKAKAPKKFSVEWRKVVSTNRDLSIALKVGRLVGPSKQAEFRGAIRELQPLLRAKRPFDFKGLVHSVVTTDEILSAQIENRSPDLHRIYSASEVFKEFDLVLAHMGQHPPTSDFIGLETTELNGFFAEYVSNPLGQIGVLSPAEVSILFDRLSKSFPRAALFQLNLLDSHHHIRAEEFSDQTRRILFTLARADVDTAILNGEDPPSESRLFLYAFGDRSDLKKLEALASRLGHDYLQKLIEKMRLRLQ